MVKKNLNTVRLGIFVLTGILLLVTALYFIGKEEALFQRNFTLYTRFSNVGGLVPGNNVWFSGINVGVVNSVSIVNDTTIEVQLSVRDDLKKVIRKNAVTSIGTEGVIGNRVVNISPVREIAALVSDGDTLQSKPLLNTSQMLDVLGQTNRNVAKLSEELIVTVDRINSSTVLISLLNDPALSADIKTALSQLRKASTAAASTMQELQDLVDATSRGEGTVGTLLRDTAIAVDLQDATERLGTITREADKLVTNLNTITTAIEADYSKGKGPGPALLRDSLMTGSLQQTLLNVEQGTKAFNENMEALKHNFLLRRYFKKKGK